MLTGDKLDEAVKCVGDVPLAPTLDDPTYDEYVANLETMVNGFYDCLLLQDITNVVVDGFCGPGTADDNKVSLKCADDLCCGAGLAKKAGIETTVYSC